MLLAVIAALALPAGALASKDQWSIFEDHPYLVRSDATTREKLLDEVQQLGPDTIRVEVKWNEVAPDAYSKKKPSLNQSDPSAYPGFGPYDDLIKSVTNRGLRVLVTITGDAPVWATSGGRGGNYKPNASEYASFATAVGKRYSGTFGGLPAVHYFTIWNEPNHIQFIKPASQAPVVYRALVDKGVPALKAAAAPGSKIFVGELKPTPRKGLGPLKFLQNWLCLDSKYKRLRGKAARKLKCTKFKKVNANGFAHHPYGPVGVVSKRVDIVNMLGIKRLAKALDLAGRAGRITKKLPIYNTEFGIQSNPPDIFVSTSPTRQAQVLNEKEEYSYRYPRLKSYSQYQLYDDPARPGPAAVRWSGFQTGLRFADGRQKPAYDAYRFPIVLKKSGGKLLVWGRVRPGTGQRSAQLQRRSGSKYVDAGSRIATDSKGYFTTKVSRGTYRFQAYAHLGSTSSTSETLLGTSRSASPPKK
jgi:Cellulase (glycosyl hydrolase family 5)